MNKDKHILSLSESMELTMDKANLSVIADYGEIIIDAVIDDGLLREIPILGTIVGTGKCITNVSDVLFAKKLIAFFMGIKDTDTTERQKAILKWEEDAKYRLRVGETLLNMIQRCDDSQKARWLSKLFYILVLKRQDCLLFMRAEKVLSSLSVMDVQNFLSLPYERFRKLSLEEAEPFATSGLYRVKDTNRHVQVEIIQLRSPIMQITVVGEAIYKILTEIDF